MEFDWESKKIEFLAVLRKNGIAPQNRSAGRFNKVGSVERNNKTIKLILLKIAYAYAYVGDVWVVKSGMSLSKASHGDQLVSFSELDRGYTTS